MMSAVRLKERPCSLLVNLMRKDEQGKTSFTALSCPPHAPLLTTGVLFQKESLL
jgi:hypothetical protein